MLMTQASENHWACANGGWSSDVASGWPFNKWHYKCSFFLMNASLSHPPERVTDTQIGIIPATGGVCDKSSQGKQLRFNDNWLPVWQQAEALNPLTSCPILTPGGDREARWHMTPSSQFKVVAEPRKQRGVMHLYRLLHSYSVCLVLL